jgi:hypothetical protein
MVPGIQRRKLVPEGVEGMVPFKAGWRIMFINWWVVCDPHGICRGCLPQGFAERAKDPHPNAV